MKHSTAMCTLRATKTFFLLGILGFAFLSFYQFHQRLKINQQHASSSSANKVAGTVFRGRLQVRPKTPPMKSDSGDKKQEAKTEPPPKPTTTATTTPTTSTKAAQTTSTSTTTTTTTTVKTTEQRTTTAVNSSIQSQPSANTTNLKQQNAASAASATPEQKPKMYAVYACSTPTMKTYRSYDFAFSLPLTALAWERVNYSSIVLLIGKKEDWEKDAVLQQVLKELSQRDARVVFLDAAPENDVMLSHTARLFVANMKQAGLTDDDYILTTDADVWPLRREHFSRKPGYHVSIVHDQCCKMFKYKEKNYTMLPTCHIGAPVKVWKDIVHRNESSAQDAETILQFIETYFGKDVARKKIESGSEEWSLDQKLVSILVAGWTEGNHAEAKIHKVSDEGFDRLDKAKWDAGNLGSKDVEHMYDAHLPEKAYEPNTWNKIGPLVKLMYGNDSAQTKWCNEYASNFAKGIEAIRNKDKPQ